MAGIGNVLKNGLKFIRSLDTGAMMKVGAGIFMFVGGLGVALAASSDEFLLEDGSDDIIQAENVTVTDGDTNTVTAETSENN